MLRPLPRHLKIWPEMLEPQGSARESGGYTWLSDRVSRALYYLRHRDTPKVFPVTALNLIFLLNRSRPVQIVVNIPYIAVYPILQLSFRTKMDMARR